MKSCNIVAQKLKFFQSTSKNALTLNSFRAQFCNDSINNYKEEMKILNMIFYLGVHLFLLEIVLETLSYSMGPKTT